MDNLSPDQRAFIQLMKSDEDFERHGFALLLKRPNFDWFFEALATEGLFDPARNPGPVVDEKPGYYRLPYWPPLVYLEAVAVRARECADGRLSDEVMHVVRGVSRWRDENNGVRDNSNTWSAFAKLLGLLPTGAVSIADTDLIPIWLAGPFRQSMVGHALVSCTLPSFLTSELPEDWIKACRILYHCTAFEFVGDGQETRKANSDVRTLVDDYWLKNLIDTNAGEFGRKIGRAAADVFVSRLKDLFGQSMGGRDSWVFRPAIEDHEQNRSWRSPYNRFVEGLRDTVLAWIDNHAQEARGYVEGLLSSGSEVVERVAIYLVDQRFGTLRGLVAKVVSPSFFDSGHRHEVYLFLTHHFPHFTEEEKTQALNAIRDLPLPDRQEDPERRQRSAQRQWLSAISGQGYEAADIWLAQLNEILGPVGSYFHPDFNSYITTGWGYGPTPHNVQELVGFAERGIIVERLNAFAPSDAWDGPSTRSLSDAVVDAVGAAPETFVDLLPQFLDAKPEYQYSVIAGFKKLWDAWDGKQAGLPWDQIWPKIVSFFETLLSNDDFWKVTITAEVALSPNRNWIAPAISEFLRAGTRSDDKAYAPNLLGRTRSLITILLDKSEPQEGTAKGNAFDVAINTAKGKAIEALLDYALRCCRLSDKANKAHAEAWQDLQPLFDKELTSCRDGNFEFSTFAGAYIGNIHYMSETWFDQNFKNIFPVEFATNCLSALDGLAFAAPTKPVYVALVASGVLDWALQQEVMGERARESLLQRMGLAYLWNQEALGGPRFSYIFGTRRTIDLEAIGNYF